MSVLILKNAPNEGPGTIEDFLVANNIDYRIIDLSSEDIPPTDDFNALVILGGPMSVNDADKYPYINREIELVRDFAKKNRKIFGICLGAQIMAKAFGAKRWSYGGRTWRFVVQCVPRFTAGAESRLHLLIPPSTTTMLLTLIPPDSCPGVRG